MYNTCNILCTVFINVSFHHTNYFLAAWKEAVPENIIDVVPPANGLPAEEVSTSTEVPQENKLSEGVAATVEEVSTPADVPQEHKLSGADATPVEVVSTPTEVPQENKLSESIANAAEEMSTSTEVA